MTRPSAVQTSEVHCSAEAPEISPICPYPPRTSTATVIVMAAEPEIHPPEPPSTSAPAIASATEAAVAIPEATAVAPTVTTAQPHADTAGPPLATKRQRRPSVRLGEIGNQPSTLAYESHARRPSMPPWSWRFPRDSSAAKAAKPRSFTNLASGGSDSHDTQEFGERNNLCADGSTEFGNRKARAKRGSTTKRVRSHWVSRAVDGEEGDGREDGDEGFRDFDPDSDAPLKGHSPVHSVHDVGLDFWHIGRRRVSDTPENDNLPESDSGYRRCGTSEGVRSWLIELGLSRYAPMFEIHEVDDELLPMLTLEDLKDMGISAVGSRRKMYTAIQKLRKGFS